MKNIIALYGKSNVGKSETIRMVYEKLTNNFSEFIFDKDFNQIIPQTGDICVIIKINGLVIGIESQGDPNSRIFKSLPKFVNSNCDIILCATRTRGATVNIVNQYQNDYGIKWIKKVGTMDGKKFQQDQDEKISNEILTEINKLIE